MPGSNESYFPLPLNPLDVESYHTSLKYVITNSQNPSDALKQYKIVKVSHYKNRKRASQHELLLATIKHDDGSHQFIRLERFSAASGVPTLENARTSTNEDERLVGEAFAKDVALAQMSSSKNSAENGIRRLKIKNKLISGSILNSSPTAAQDYIKLMERDYKVDCSSSIEVDFVEPHSLYLYQLAIIAKVVHDRDPIYTLLRHQCYWFAAMVIATIRQLEKGAACSFSGTRTSPTPIPPSVRDHDEILVAQRRVRGSRRVAGTFQMIPIIYSYPVMVDRLWINTLTEIKSWHNEINERKKLQKLQDQELVNNQVAPFAEALRIANARIKELEEQRPGGQNPV